jgi:hypothetical protein
MRMREYVTNLYYLKQQYIVLHEQVAALFGVAYVTCAGVA